MDWADCQKEIRPSWHLYGHGQRRGCTVNDVDDHDGFDGHRLFQVVYNDGDDEWMEVDELASILQPIENEESTADVVSACLLLILLYISSYIVMPLNLASLLIHNNRMFSQILRQEQIETKKRSRESTTTSSPHNLMLFISCSTSKLLAANATTIGSLQCPSCVMMKTAHYLAPLHAK